MTKQSKSTGKIVLIIVIVVIVLAGLAGAWYWFKYLPEQKAKEKARLEQLAKEEAERLAQEIEAQKQANYQDLLKNADAEFQSGNLEAARLIYSESSKLYPDQGYPKDQMALIDAKLAELAAIEAAKPGTIESISRATGRYYVILSSSIDDDLAMDFAKKLSKKKVNVKILQTRNDTHTYFAVSPADFATRAEAENAVSSFSEYGSGIWVIRY